MPTGFSGLVRTSTQGRRQEGISFLLIDMKSPGVTVRPIVTIEGEREINEIWFDNVRVPVEKRVGEESKGWTYAKFLLGHERTDSASIGGCKSALKKLKRIASEQVSKGRPLIENARFRRLPGTAGERPLLPWAQERWKSRRSVPTPPNIAAASNPALRIFPACLCRAGKRSVIESMTCGIELISSWTRHTTPSPLHRTGSYCAEVSALD